MRFRMLAWVAFLGVVSISHSQRLDERQSGESVLCLTPAEQAAVDSFLKSHPGFQPANCITLKLNSAECAEENSEWLQTVREQKAIPQYQFAAWGDFRHKSVTDVIIPFFSDRPVNNWNWRQWDIVAFESSARGQYSPVIAVRGTWGTCFDGILFHPVRKQVEFWCKTMGGSVKWNGLTYVGQIHKGD
jgi:hypothetical protein